MESSSAAGAAVAEAEREADRAKLLGEVKKKKVGVCDLFLRIVSLLFTLGAVVIFGLNRETTTVGVELVPGLPEFNVGITAKWEDSPSFVYFLVANGAAFLYGILSFIISIINRGRKKGLVLMILLLDLATVATLFSSLGAATAVGVIAYKGNSSAEWGPICGAFKRFCHLAAAGIAVSAVACIIFFLLVLIAAINLHKRAVI